MVFPNWGAMSANIVNSMNRRKGIGLIGDYVKERATTKDKFIGFGIMFVIATFIWLAFIICMVITN